MAVLNTDDYQKLREHLYQWGTGKEELKALSNLPNKSQMLAAFQAIEDFWTTNAATLKTNMEVALGRPISVALARKIGLAWLTWKVGKGG